MSSFLLDEFTRRVHNGAVYHELLSVPNTQHVASAIVDEEFKLVYPDSRFTVDLVTDSYKYGRELQFKSWTERLPKRIRRNDTDNRKFRLECGYLSVNTQTADLLRRIADVVDSLCVRPVRKVVERVVTEDTPLAELL